ncbi:MAG: FAD-dependent oxidoreductase [Chitinivibrionales bacterium]|nr:FAD-dependent oxidoreductase [Chitinivibrionales bacterium]
MDRIEKHPILPIPSTPKIPFRYNEVSMTAKQGEMISSALFAHGVTVFGYHHKDHAPLGIYCANGQCSQCTVIANGKPVKACMTPVVENMEVTSCNGKPALPADDTLPPTSFAPPVVQTECLIIGGGPAGLSAAIELAKFGVKSILADDKFTLGGKLTLQTHNFFGSRGDCFAGTRGIDIATILEKQLEEFRGSLVDVWLNSTVAGVFFDKRVGVVKNGAYVLVEPTILLVAAGAREKTLAFPGCDLPGVYGAGAFQTLVNRDLIKPTNRLFICGGGNVGLIGGYHALQAGVDVVGVVEALPYCGGYKVHLDKLRRFGVPIYTSHTIVRAQGSTALESVTIGKITDKFKLIPGTEQTFKVDTLLIAVGLSPINEMYHKAKMYGMNVCAAGDAEEIAEASAAMFSGRIQGRKIAQQLRSHIRIPQEWDTLVSTLRSKPGSTKTVQIRQIPGKIYPVIRCIQEIPCNPCSQTCPKGAIRTDEGQLTGLPSFNSQSCLGCGQCVLACPGLAIVLVDEAYDPTNTKAVLTIPFELPAESVTVGDEVTTVGIEGEKIGQGKIIALRLARSQDRRSLMLLEVPYKDRLDVAGISLYNEERGEFLNIEVEDGDTIICRCERIPKREIVRLIRAGYRDLNAIKAQLRTGMGACNGKNCTELIMRIFREEGVAVKDVAAHVYRPPENEVPLGVFAGIHQ